MNSGSSMFKLIVSPVGNFKKYEFREENSKTSFSLIPETGALISNIAFNGQKVLDGCECPEEISQNSRYKSALMLPFPNRLKNGRFRWLGKTYQFPLNNPDPPVNALHGFAYDYPATVEKIELKNDSAGIICRMDYEGTLEYYPYPFSAFFKYIINTDGDFEVRIKIQNTGKEPLPFGTGWHPYFRLSGVLDNWHLRLPTGYEIEVDEHLIPTGEEKFSIFDTRLKKKQLDTCFRLKNTGGILKTVLKNKQSKLIFRQETGEKKFNFLQVFIPGDRSCLAIEPMTCNIDAFNNGEGLIRLEPGEIWQGKFGFKFEYFDT